MNPSHEMTDRRQGECVHLLEGDGTTVTVFMSDGGRLNDQTVDRVVQATATQEAFQNAAKRLQAQLKSALNAIHRWAEETPSVKKIAGIVGRGPKARVLFVTEGERFSEEASEALESLSSEVFDLLKNSPFRFRYYLTPEGVERAARQTFLDTITDPDDAEEQGCQS